MAGDKGRFLDDRESLEAIIRSMPTKEKDLYDQYGALSKEATFPNRKMVVYTLFGGKPTNVEVITMGDIEVTRIGGPVVEVADSRGKALVGVVPQRWRDRDLFIQVPQHFELRWTGKQVREEVIHFIPSYAMLFKTLSKEFHQVEGHTYVATLNKFRERFKDVPMRY